MADLNWDDLRFFLALAREHRVSAAGRILGVKHTTVARRIDTLETRLGTRLFDRSAGGYAMTQAAENLYEHALVMEERALAVDREIIGMDNQLVGSLKLTAPHDLLTRMVVPVLHRLQDAYPGLDIDLIGTTGLLDLAARQADIALRLTAKPPDYLIGRKVLPLCHGVYASTRYLGTPRKQESVILWDSEDNFPQWVEQHFKGAKLALRTDDVNVMAAAVKHHCGLARMPCFVGDREADLRRIDVSLNPSTWGVWVLSHVDLRSTARVRVCREFLVDIMIEQRGLIEGLNSRYA
jgi:DNA-binding transcriptional LysR family regulator